MVTSFNRSNTSRRECDEQAFLVGNIQKDIHAMYKNILTKYEAMYTAQKETAEYCLRSVRMHIEEQEATGANAHWMPGEQ